MVTAMCPYLVLAVFEVSVCEIWLFLVFISLIIPYIAYKSCISLGI